MENQLDTLELLAQNIAIGLNPLLEVAESPEALEEFIADLGWSIPDPGLISTLGLDINKIEALENALDSVLELDTETSNKTEIAQAYSLLLAAVIGLVKHIYELSSRLDSHLDSAFISTTQITQKFPKRLMDYLILNYLEDFQNSTFFALLMLGIAELKEIDQDDSEYISEHIRYIIHYDRIGILCSDPIKLLEDVYNWGTSSSDLNLFLERLNEFVLSLGLPASLVYPEFDKEQNLSSPAIIPEEGEAENLELRIPIVYTDDIAGTEAGITLVQLPPVSDGGSRGLALCPYASGAIEENFPIDPQGLWKLTLSSTLDLVLGIGLIFRPNESLRILTDIFGNSTDASGQLGVAISRTSFEDERISIIGTSDGTGLTTKTIKGEVQILVGTGQDTDFKIEFNLIEGRLRITLDSVDSFLESGLPLDPIDISFDLGIGWSHRKGAYFTGGAGLEYSLPLHKTLGPFKLDILHFGLKLKDGNLELMMAITGGMLLGPLSAVVEKIGMELVADLQSGNGNLGVVDLSPKFKPPNGVGLAINASVIKGGGYLFFDHDRGEYAGALELVFSEWIALKAIGLITTKMPDGSKGFSLLIIITAEFGAGIQLGYGFTLLGVGGLLGWNRTVKIEALKEGVKTGGIANVLFPEDVVANAPRIISDLKKFFPPAKDSFLIGPMAKIGWWSPQIIDVTIGIILEFPQISITILGVLKATLPNEAMTGEGAEEGAEGTAEKEILKLQVNFLGRIEPSNKLMWFYAELYDSRLLKFTLEGSMGVLLSWGDNPNFVLSVGGFHPRYTPPPLPFPSPKRIALTILNKPAAKIRLENYFAVTSNTVQFGARAELHFGFSEVNVDGFIGFDTLFQFDPFYFISEFSAGLSVKVFGFGLYTFSVTGMLEGPTQWHIKGKGKMKITWLGPTIEVPIDKTWGEEQQTVLPPIPVLPLLVKEFSAITNWVAIIPEHSSVLVTFRKENEPQPGSAREAETKDKPLVFHPEGKIRISQLKIPANLKLDWIGNQRPSDINQFSVTAKINKNDDLAIERVMEKFAPSQFKDLDNAKKLSSPGFEWYEGGIEIKTKGEQLKTSMAVKRIIRPETIIIDANYNREKFEFFEKVQKGFAAIQHKLFRHFLKGNAVTKSTLSQRYRKQMQPNDEGIRILPNQYSVVDVNTNEVYKEKSDGDYKKSPQFSSKTGAIDYMEEQIKNNPGNATRLHVIPNTELNVA